MRLLHNKSRAAALYLICIRSCHSAESPRTPVKSYRCARDRAVERNFSNVQPRRAQRPFVRRETFAGRHEEEPAWRRRQAADTFAIKG